MHNIISVFNTKTSFPRMGKRFFVGLIGLGLMLMIYSGLQSYFYQRSIALSADLIASYESVSEDKVVPVRIAVNNRIDLEIEIAPFVEGNWVVSETQATYLAPSVGVGDEGNMIVYGHNKREILGDLVSVDKGDEIKIWGSDGEEYMYRVEKVAVVNPDEVEMLVKVDGHTLVVYTCTGFMDSQRFVLRARLVE